MIFFFFSLDEIYINQHWIFWHKSDFIIAPSKHLPENWWRTYETERSVYVLSVVCAFRLFPHTLCAPSMSLSRSFIVIRWVYLPLLRVCINRFVDLINSLLHQSEIQRNWKTTTTQQTLSYLYRTIPYKFTSSLNTDFLLTFQMAVQMFFIY